MNKIIFLPLLLLLFCNNINAQDMDNQKLHDIIHQLSDEVEGVHGNWRFIIDSTIFICLTDEVHNRMRIISPIVEAEKVTDTNMKKCMEANFHSALDAKYAIGEDILWSTFIHPLQELTQTQVLSGIAQVYSCAKTYGTYYSSGALSFPTQDDKKIRQN